MPRSATEMIGRASRMTLFWVAIITLVVGVGFAVVLVGHAYCGGRLLAQGVQAEGVVTWSWPATGKDGPQIGYAFKVRAREYTGRSFVSDQAYAGLRVGSSIAVTYLPADPRVNGLASGGLRNYLLSLCLLSVLSVAFLAVAIRCGKLVLLAVGLEDDDPRWDEPWPPQG